MGIKLTDLLVSIYKLQRRSFRNGYGFIHYITGYEMEIVPTSVNLVKRDVRGRLSRRDSSLNLLPSLRNPKLTK